MLIIHDLEYEYNYKLVDMVYERPESAMRSCTLAMLTEPIELYVRNFHDLLLVKQTSEKSKNISRILVEILLTLNNEETQKFKETYENLFQNLIEKDIEIVEGEKGIISNLLIELLKGKRIEEPNSEPSIAKVIAKKLYEAGEGTPGIDYDTFIRIFTRDSLSQLSAIFDIYEDIYKRPIQEAIEREFHGQIETECFLDIVEFTRSPGRYYSKILRQTLDDKSIDYVILARIIIGHEDKDLSEIKLEYSKIYDETLDQTIQNRIDIAEIKRLFNIILTRGDDKTVHDNEQVRFDNENNSHSPTLSRISSTSSLSNSNGMRRNRSHEAFDKFINVFKTIRPH